MIRLLVLKKYFIPVIALIIFFNIRQISAAEPDFRGQISGWAVTNPDIATQTGLRYIPDFLLGTDLSDYWLDSEISFKMYGTVQYSHTGDSIDTYHDFSAYRLWLRLSASQYEIRIGLQKINFGSAMLLRPMMWFDSIDPRDPLQLTDGVYGILGRYYFLNNANIWLWILYGNDRTRGWEIFVSDKNKPEFGGRLQVPLFSGEFAVTYHHRALDPLKNPLVPLMASPSGVAENRIGLDGKWDIEVGFWVEDVLIHRDLTYDQLSYQRQTNIGMDYTFDIGNGLGAIAEHFTLRTSEKAFGSGEGVSMTAFSLNYPIGLLDDLTGMMYYDWDNKNGYRFISWRRTYDNWRFFLMGFWNPDQYQLLQASTINNLYAGKGLQLLVVFNH
jgi:hypothetical protein